jgi:hypothetical protein
MTVYFIQLVEKDGVLSLPESEKISGVKIRMIAGAKVAVVETTENTQGEEILKKYDIGEEKYGELLKEGV